MIAARATSGDTLTLTDGRVLRLEGIKAPASNDAARTELQSLTVNKSLLVENSSVDRYGRLTGQVSIDGDKHQKIWAQGEMLRTGLAFIYPPTGDETRLSDMRAAENEARQARRGIWAVSPYADIPADHAQKSYGRFAFVIGTVQKAERIKNKVYLNFGADWKTDFTVAIAAHDLRAFRQAGIDPLLYKDKTVRVRGWVKRDFGPMITVTSPWQIEIITPAK